MPRRIKRMLMMPDDRRLPRRPHNRDHIKPARRLRRPVPGQIIFRRPDYLILLNVVHLLLRLGIIIRPRLHLQKNQRLPVARDDINLPQVATEIAHDDLIPAIAQMPRRHVLATIPQCVLRRFRFE